ncbi:MAG: hypothetical protein GYA55_04620 [SAR324 cluster bacterium]|uniref:Uncharacterized protein n=1 Tax=SAR324 cluster bacterium TaxID=2024889 RepID=A0A7X9FQG9_9DELT|nr:hypothetical protein [SAR324 cluster bacterium]
MGIDISANATAQRLTTQNILDQCTSQATETSTATNIKNTLDAKNAKTTQMELVRVDKAIANTLDKLDDKLSSRSGNLFRHSRQGEFDEIKKANPNLSNEEVLRNLSLKKAMDVLMALEKDPRGLDLNNPEVRDAAQKAVTEQVSKRLEGERIKHWGKIIKEPMGEQLKRCLTDHFISISNPAVGVTTNATATNTNTPPTASPELTAEQKELVRIADLIKSKKFLDIAAEELGDNATLGQVKARQKELQLGQGNKTAEEYAKDIYNILQLSNAKRELGGFFSQVIGKGFRDVLKDDASNRILDRIYGISVALNDPEKFLRLLDPKNAKYNPGGRFTNGVSIPTTLDQYKDVIKQVNEIIVKYNAGSLNRVEFMKKTSEIFGTPDFSNPETLRLNSQEAKNPSFVSSSLEEIQRQAAPVKVAENAVGEDNNTSSIIELRDIKDGEIAG